MAFTVFPRQESMTPPQFLTGPKLVSAIGHCLIGFWIYCILRSNAGGRFVESLFIAPTSEQEADPTFVTPVQGNRIPFFVLFSTIYGLRWGFLGAFTTNAGNPMPWNATFQVLFLHTLLYVLTMTVFSTLRGGLPGTLSQWDYMAFVLSILAGILQHGSEYQRLVFKLDPQNKGQVHTGGLFAYARYMNHTGHILQDAALALATRSWGLAVMTMVGMFFICGQLTPETEAHMHQKYKEKYQHYVQKTPNRFVPRVW